MRFCRKWAVSLTLFSAVLRSVISRAVRVTPWDGFAGSSAVKAMMASMMLPSLRRQRVSTIPEPVSANLL